MAHYYPSIEKFRELAQGSANLIPVYRDVVADLETPVSAYLKIARGPHSFLFESVEGGERLARYSFMGTEPYRALRCGPGLPDGPVDPLTLVEAELSKYRIASVEGLPRFLGGAVGYLAYECAHYFEPRVPLPQIDPHGLPEAVFLFTESIVVFDHLKHRIQIVAHAYVEGRREGGRGLREGGRAYRRARGEARATADALHRPARRATGGWRIVRRPRLEQNAGRVPGNGRDMGRRYVIAGDVIQVVPSQRLEIPVTAAPFDILPGAPCDQPLALYVLRAPRRL